jgi:hypothetical protein
LRVGVPNGLLNIQRAIAGVKTHQFEDLYIIGNRLKCRCLMGSHDPFGHLKHKLWSKERSRVKLAVWFPTIKSQESTQFPCLQVAWDIPLESSLWEIQLCFRPHCNQRFAHDVTGPQNHKSPNCRNFRTPISQSWDKIPFGCGPVERHKKYYKGEGGGFPQAQVVVSLVNPRLLVARPNTKNALTNFLFGLCRFVWVIKCLSFFLIHVGALACPSTLEVLRAKERALTPCSSIVITLCSPLSLSRSLGVHHVMKI